MLIDTHAHLYLKAFDNDIDKVIERAKSNNISKVILPNIDENSVAKLTSLKNLYPDFFYSALGLHPTSVAKNYKEQLDIIFESYDDSITAIGETGIDLYWDKTMFKEQKEAFIYQLNFSAEKNKPVIIHSRESMTEILELLNDYDGNKFQGVFHCFPGTVEQANKIIDMGFYIGIGGVVTYKKSSTKEVVKEIPLDNILLETDSPFLPPTPHRGKRNEPSYLTFTAEKIAEIKNTDIQTVVNATGENAKKCFSL